MQDSNKTPQRDRYDGMSIRQILDEVSNTSKRPDVSATNHQTRVPVSYPSDKKYRNHEK